MKIIINIILLLLILGCKKYNIDYIPNATYKIIGSIRYSTDYKEEVFLHNINLPMNASFEGESYKIHSFFNGVYKGVLKELKLAVLKNKLIFSAFNRDDYELKVKKVDRHSINMKFIVNDLTSIHFENYFDQTCRNKKGQNFRIRTYVSVDGEYLLSNFIVKDMAYITSDDVNYYQSTDSNGTGEKINNEGFVKIILKRI